MHSVFELLLLKRGEVGDAATRQLLPNGTSDAALPNIGQKLEEAAILILPKDHCQLNHRGEGSVGFAALH